MRLLEWRNTFSIGIPEIDHEHQRLIAHINTLLEVSLTGEKAAVVDALGELDSLIAAHFALEEKIMRSQGYSGYAEHKEEHERLLDGLRDIMDRYEREQTYDAAALAAALESWFVLHFRAQDARWHRSLMARLPDE